MKLLRICIVICSVLHFSVWSQDSLYVQIQAVEISDHMLRDYAQSQKTKTINDSMIKRSPGFLTSILNYNSLIYFKENGYGGASSPSFRGTTAAQTAVIWNGININSQFLGQTDFNAFTTLNATNIIVKSGGGSVLYGSSAIGGSIHLNNDLYFYEHFDTEVLLRYGSFNTLDTHVQTTIASKLYSFRVGVTHVTSDNDYTWLNKNRKNLNGQFENVSFNVDFGYKINKHNTLKFNTQYFDGERHFSLILPSETPTKYHNTNLRNLVTWSSVLGKFNSNLKLAHLHEQYNYYPDIDSDHYAFGKVESLIAKYDLGYQVSDKLQLNSVFDFTQNKGQGSDIQNEKRQIGALSLMMKHLVTDRLLYEIALRKEATDNYNSPFLYSVGLKYDATAFYSLKLNTSKNFRIPTFNDLYWTGSGNPRLNPETSYQAELSHVLRFGALETTLTTYYNHIKDMLRWIPSSSIWEPINTAEVEVMGVEVGVSYFKSYGKHSVNLQADYGYTASKDKQTDKFLVYVPAHKANASLVYGFDGLSVFGELLYVGEVYTRSDNKKKYNLKAYQTLNIGADYTLSKAYTLGVKVQNIANVFYESVENRTMPGRNYMAYLSIKI
ncbi:MAG TPA: TonB-dependent receptor [Flavobacterium sp.]|nr:TonB-dependent receptor [Flavobacterium sp.]